MRANLRLLAGEFAESRRDCRAVFEIGQLYAATVCASAAQTGPDSVARARNLLAALGVDDAASIELRRWRLLTEADLASRADDAGSALGLLERAHALDTTHEEARTQLAELVLEQGDPARSLGLALAPNPSPARLVIQIRAALALDDPRAEQWHHDLDDMLDLDRQHGIPPHLREESQIALHVDRDAGTALALAQENFVTQKDTRDLRMLVAAALVAGDPNAVDAIRSWLSTTGFEDRAVARQLGATARFSAVAAPLTAP